MTAPPGRVASSRVGSSGAATGSCREVDGVPDLLRLHAHRPDRYPILFESSAGAAPIARFDILFAFPGEVLVLDAGWQLHGPGSIAGDTDFFRALDRWCLESPHAGSGPADPLPFGGGWFVFLAYEAAGQAEPSLKFVADPRLPVALAVRIPAALIHDRASGRCFVVAERGREDLCEMISADVRDLARRGAPRCLRSLLRPGTSAEEDDPAQFLDAVERIRTQIRAGNVYQVNISRRWGGSLAPGVEPWMVYSRLRTANPAPFGGLVRLDDLVLASSSPERLLRAAGGRVETRPIAGTRPRRAPDSADPDRRSALLGSPKERAEHLMLLDLERNDLGRICAPGSVVVDELMTVESYAHVHHIVSNVSGRLRPGVGPGSMLRAVFPGGTITGCPKISCMRIVGALERRPRGAYTGTMGYVNHDGSGDFNILIRTVTLSGESFTLDAGSGIVWDSVATRELAETRAKAKGMLLAMSGPTAT